MVKVLLASSSPRRRELLSKLTSFTVVVPSAEEICDGSPEFVAVTNAKLKGQSIHSDNDIVIACDTVVAKDGKIYGKPLCNEVAIDMLRELNGKTHEVVSGVYIKFPDEEIVFAEKSEVEMKKLLDEEIIKYVEEYSPVDKAGAYGIQDGEVVKGYKGDYDNIVGLPLSRIEKIFVEKGYVKE